MRIREVGHFAPAFDDLWRAVEPGLGVTAVRDAAYLNWRYAACPGRRYTTLAAFRGSRLDGFLVFRTRRERGDAVILELLTRAGNGADAAQALVAAAVDRLRRLDVGLVAASFPARSSSSAVLRSFGFIPHVDRLLRIEVAVWPGPGMANPQSAIRHWPWYFTLGDCLTY